MHHSDLKCLRGEKASDLVTGYLGYCCHVVWRVRVGELCQICHVRESVRLLSCAQVVMETQVAMETVTYETG